ncbi:MAG: TPM domain-containing protein [Clostridia bacterium]|nr:TPM domain-containing protein [Clostridia bacterium]
MKKIISLLLVLMLCASFTVAVSAADAEETFIYDHAELLAEYDETLLNLKLSEISEKYQAQVIVMTVNSLDGKSIDTYLNSTYDSQGFGYGQNHDGVLLLVCMETREWRILSNGFAGEAILPDTIDTMGEEFSSDLSSGDYYSAFKTFADECEYYLNGYLNGFPFETGKALLISLGAGLLIALGVTSGWKKQLKSVQKQSKANDYVKTGSMQITQSGDYFMYRNVTRTEKPSSSSSSSSRSSGGSSRSTGGGRF